MHSDKVRHRLRRFLQLLGAFAVLAVLALAFLIFLKSEHESLYRGNRRAEADSAGPHGSSDSLQRLFSSNITEEDRALAAKFSDDTLPTLLRLGLIRELRHGESNGLLIVDGPKWHARRKEFKEELLSQLRAYHKVSNLPTPLQIRDGTSKELLAEITPASHSVVYR